MPHLPRLLAPLCAAAALAAVAPAAHAASTATFPDTTVTITDAGPGADTVHLTVTADTPADLADTKVFLGGDTATPYYAIGTDGVRDARYADGEDVEGEISTLECAAYAGSEVVASAPVTVANDGASYSADLPKGEVISFEDTGVDVGIVGRDTSCSTYGYFGLEVDYANTHETIDGFSWADPATPVVTQAVGGRRQVSLTFAQRLGTQYDIYRAGDSVPFRANLRGEGDAVRVDITESDDGQQLAPGTTYAFQVRATRLFNVWNADRTDMFQPVSALSAATTVTTAAVQTLRFTTTPASGTTSREAGFGWTMTGNDSGAAPFCVLDEAREVPCTATGASLTGLPVGTHTLGVYPADGENGYTHSWTVVAAAAAPAVAPAPIVAKPAAPAAAKNDLDGDGIKNTWLVNGKPAAAPAAPKATAGTGGVKLTFGKAPRGAKSIRVYRKSDKGGYKVVKTVKPTAKSFTDKSARRGKKYSYKTVAVNAKGKQSSASKEAVVQVAKAPAKRKAKKQGAPGRG